MKPFNVLFEEANSEEIIYNGYKIRRGLRYKNIGNYKLKFTFVKTNSKFIQAIDLHISTFEGTIFKDGKELKSNIKRFPQIIFYEDCSEKSFELEVSLKKGCIWICNGVAEIIDNQRVCASLEKGFAMRIENMTENKYRCYCNDIENDDDFDDLIFDLEIIK